MRLATFTLVNVLKNQALFYQALEVLDLLEKKGEDPDMIRLERDSIKNLIKSSEKEDNKKWQKKYILIDKKNYQKS